MIKKEKITTTKEVTKIYCDFCGSNLNSTYSRRCEICHRDGCNKHIKVIYGDGDYPDHVFCVSCNEIVSPYLKKIDEIEKKYDDMFEKEYDELKKEYSNKCLEKYKKEIKNDKT